MPEGHTIHRLARDHTRDFAGQLLAVSSPQGRFAEGAAWLDGHTLRRVEACGKHLFYRWAGAPILHIHLGLFGSFRHWPTPAPEPRASVQLRLVGTTAAADLVGATICRLISTAERTEIVRRLGPDLLNRSADPERAWQRLKGRTIPIGVALLDQRILAGVGNVYRAEALFVNGIHPERSASMLTRAEFDGLWATLARMLRQGMKDRRIVTVHRSERVGRRRGGVGPEDAFYVYHQQTCRRCGGPIRSWPLGTRRAYACEHCQPLPRPDPENDAPRQLDTVLSATEPRASA